MNALLGEGVSLIAGAIIGVVATTLFQSSFDSWRNVIYAKSRDFLMNFNGVKPTDHFAVRNIDTSIHVIDGDGILNYSSETLRFRMVDAPSLPADLMMRRSRIEAEQAGKRDAGLEPHWNGPQLGLVSWDIGRTVDESVMSMSLDVYRGDYFTFLATCASIIEERREGRSEIYDNHLKGSSGGVPVAYLSCGVGVVVAVLTADRKLVTARRAAKSGVRAYELDLCIAESINPEVDFGEDNMIDPWRTAARGVFEELGIPVERKRVSMCGFAVDTACHQFNFIAICELELTHTELSRRRARGGPGKWELQNLKFLSLDDADINEGLEKSSKWGFNYLTLYWMVKRYMPHSALRRLFH